MKLAPILLFSLVLVACVDSRSRDNTSAFDEQDHTEKNQKSLMKVQPPPDITWSLERDNLTKRFKLMNERTISFYMYVFIEGVSDPIGYYQVNKVSSVNSQLTNTSQVVNVIEAGHTGSAVLPSPAEDGSYGTNGEGVFGFTPEDIYIEHNMKYIVSTVPLTFTRPVNRLAVLTPETSDQLKQIMAKINK